MAKIQMAKIQNIDKPPAAAPALTSDQKLAIRDFEVKLLRCKVNQMDHQEKLANLKHEEQHILASLRDMIQAAMPEGYTITGDLDLIPKPEPGLTPAPGLVPKPKEG